MLQDKINGNDGTWDIDDDNILSGLKNEDKKRTPLFCKPTKDINQLKKDWVKFIDFALNDNGENNCNFQILTEMINENTKKIIENYTFVKIKKIKRHLLKLF